MTLTIIAWAVLFYGFYILYKEYETLPDVVPTKYDLDGSVKETGPKNTLYVLVGVGFATAILMTGLLFFEGIEKAQLVLESTHLFTQLLFTYIIFQTIKVVKGEAKGLGKEFYALLAAVVILPLILAFMDYNK